MRENVRKALQLCLLALVSYLLFYGVGVFLARVLGVGGFKSYSVAIATLTLLASLTTLGLEKYAQRALTAYCEKSEWDHARGFMVFGRNTVFVASAIVVAIYGLAVGARWIFTQLLPSWTTVLALLFLPVMALVMFMLEVLASTGEVIRSTFVYRVLLPLCIVVSLALIWKSSAEVTVALAVLCYGVAWLVTFFILRRRVLSTMSGRLSGTNPVTRPREWLRESMPFLVHSVMMTQFASLGIVGLELLGKTEQDVAVLAAAMQTGGIIVLLATATNRLYGPMASRFIERRDYPGMISTIKERHSWIIPTTVVYFAVMVVFGRRILRLFGPEFEAGYPALCFIAGGASISVWFAMAPNYLKFVGRNRQVLGITAAAGLLNVLLLMVFGSRWGATGAGAAYGISVAMMAIVFVVLGLRTARVVMQA